jgi:glutaconate CoA-transferase subunit A
MSKIKTIQEAVNLIKDGDQIITGGWTVIRRPMAAAHEIIRQGKKKLHIVCGTAGTDSDLLVGAGCLAIGEQGYVGSEKFGPAYNFQRAVAEGPEVSGFTYDDNSLLFAWLRIQAAAMGVPFLPTTSLLGSDILNPEYDTLKDMRGKNPKLAKKKYVIMKDPFFEGREIVLVPAIRPDVAIIHAHEGSENGTVYIKNAPYGDRIIGMSAPATIVTVEKIVSNEEMTKHTAENILPGMYVTAVVEMPYGAHPTQMPHHYDNDPWFYKEYRTNAKSKENFTKFVKEWILDTKDHQGYLAKLGEGRLQAIKADPVCGYNPTMERNV